MQSTPALRLDCIDENERLGHCDRVIHQPKFLTIQFDVLLASITKFFEDVGNIAESFGDIMAGIHNEIMWLNLSITVSRIG